MAFIDPNQLMYTAFEPVVQNRFIMYIDGIPSYTIKKASAPNFSVTDIKLDHINVYRKLKGKVEWQDVNLELYQPISPSGAQAVMEWIRLSHESITGRDGYSDFYKKNITLNILGPVGDIAGEWVMRGAYVKTANFGEFDWSQDQFSTIQLTLAVDYCELNF
jgi:hypothetical protein